MHMHTHTQTPNTDTVHHTHCEEAQENGRDTARLVACFEAHPFALRTYSQTIKLKLPTSYAHYTIAKLAQPIYTPPAILGVLIVPVTTSLSNTHHTATTTAQHTPQPSHPFPTTYNRHKTDSARPMAAQR